MTKFQKQLFVSLCSLYSYKRYPQIIDRKSKNSCFNIYSTNLYTVVIGCIHKPI
ncbi:hypothetical protein Hanom_Chr12g01081461 [Helianthus anomalus]